MTRVVIHQPHFLPWLGYFNKLHNADILVYQDNVQFRRAYFQNRTKIRANNSVGWRWLTVPVHASQTSAIEDVVVSGHDWKRYVSQSLLHTYASAAHFGETFEELNEVISTTNGKLFSINVALMDWALKKLEIEVEIRRASEFDKKGSAAATLVHICECVSADEYIFGEGGGKAYHGREQFLKHKPRIRTRSQRFKNGFLRSARVHYSKCLNLSVADFFFVMGVEGTRKLVKSYWVLK